MDLLKTMFLSVAMLAFASAASAATYDLGTKEYPVDGGGSVSADVTAAVGDFFDIFNFKTGSSPEGHFSAFAEDTASVEFHTIGFYNGYNALDLVFEVVYSDLTSEVELAASDFLPGDLSPYTEYSIRVDGYGTYEGDTYEFNAGPVSAVPEPSALALMLGGLGMVGFMANRRRKAA